MDTLVEIRNKNVTNDINKIWEFLEALQEFRREMVREWRLERLHFHTIHWNIGVDGRQKQWAYEHIEEVKNISALVLSVYNHLGRTVRILSRDNLRQALD